MLVLVGVLMVVAVVREVRQVLVRTMETLVSVFVTFAYKSFSIIANKNSRIYRFKHNLADINVYRIL